MAVPWAVMVTRLGTCTVALVAALATRMGRMRRHALALLERTGLAAASGTASSGHLGACCVPSRRGSSGTGEARPVVTLQRLTPATAVTEARRSSLGRFTGRSGRWCLMITVRPAPAATSGGRRGIGSIHRTRTAHLVGLLGLSRAARLGVRVPFARLVEEALVGRHAGGAHRGAPGDGAQAAPRVWTVPGLAVAHIAPPA